jgi:hypothetical protein
MRRSLCCLANVFAGGCQQRDRQRELERPEKSLTAYAVKSRKAEMRTAR